MEMEEERGAHTVLKFQQGQVRRCDPVPESDHRRVSALNRKPIRHARKGSWARRRSADRLAQAAQATIIFVLVNLQQSRLLNVNDTLKVDEKINGEEE